MRSEGMRRFGVVLGLYVALGKYVGCAVLGWSLAAGSLASGGSRPLWRCLQWGTVAARVPKLKPSLVARRTRSDNDAPREVPQLVGCAG